MLFTSMWRDFGPKRCDFLFHDLLLFLASVVQNSDRLKTKIGRQNKLSEFSEVWFVVRNKKTRETVISVGVIINCYRTKTVRHNDRGPVAPSTVRGF